MHMLLKSASLSILMSSVVVLPLATVSFVGLTDVAVAKGKGGGGGGGGASKGGGGGSSKSSRGGGGSSKSSRGGGGGSKKSSKGGGKKPKKSRSASAAPKKPKESASASARVAESEVAVSEAPTDIAALHPSERGNLNGALNANENAILAHIRNGNTNGPVGLMAQLAVADGAAEDAASVLNSPLADDYAAVEDAAQAAGYDSYQDYLDHLAENPTAETDAGIEDAVNAIGQADLQEALGEYGSYEEYELAVYGDGTAENPGDPSLIDYNIEAAHSNMGVHDSATANSLEEAEGAVASRDAALDELLEFWNKGDADSENAGTMRQELLDRVDSYQNVDRALDQMEPDIVEDGEACDALVQTCDEETALVTD